MVVNRQRSSESGKGSGSQATSTPGAPTLSSIADTMGISRTSVSYAYSRPDQISEDLRRRVLATARELGYPGPHPSARALAKGRTGVIGVAFPEELTYAFTDPTARISTLALAQACNDAKLGLLLLPTAADAREGEELIRTAAFDGIVLNSMSDDHPLLEVIRSRRTRVVTIDQPKLEDGIRVAADEARVADLQVSHLAALGHKKLGLLGYRFGPDARDGYQRPSRLRTSSYLLNRLRYQGLARGLRRSGLHWSDVVIFETRANAVEHGFLAAQQVLRDFPHVSGLIADSDTLARGAVGAAIASGMVIPGDLSVIGSDDSLEAISDVPHLTTVQLPHFEKGLAAGRLVSQADTPPVADIVLPVVLIQRESTGPAP